MCWTGLGYISCGRHWMPPTTKCGECRATCICNIWKRDSERYWQWERWREREAERRRERQSSAQEVSAIVQKVKVSPMRPKNGSVPGAQLTLVSFTVVAVSLLLVLLLLLFLFCSFIRRDITGLSSRATALRTRFGLALYAWFMDIGHKENPSWAKWAHLVLFRVRVFFLFWGSARFDLQ